MVCREKMVLNSVMCPASIVVGLNNYLYTLITLLTTPSAIPNVSQILVALAAAFLTIQFTNDPQTQYKNNPEILLTRKNIFFFSILIDLNLTIVILHFSDCC